MGRMIVVVLFLVLSLLYLDWIGEWEIAYAAKTSGWIWQYIVASFFLILGAFLLEVPRMLSSRGRINLAWPTLIAFVLPGLLLILNPFWSAWGLNVSPKLIGYLGELRLLGNMLIGLGIGKSLDFATFEYYRPRSW